MSERALPDLDELERLAKAATPGPWKIAGDNWEVVWIVAEEVPSDGGDIICDIPSDGDASRERYPSNAAYIAAAHPQAVLALIARVRELEKQYEIASSLITDGGH